MISDDFEEGYQILKNVVAPRIAETCLKAEYTEAFNDLLLKIETHIFAIRLFK